MKIIKKIIICFVCFGLLFLGLSYIASVSAEETSKLTTDENIKVTAVSIRDSDFIGVRYRCSVKDYTDLSNITKYGIIIAYGEQAADDNFKIGASYTVNSINYDVINIVIDELDDATNNLYYMSLVKIPSAEYMTYFTARPYVILNDSSIVYAKAVRVVSFAERASYYYNLNDTYESGTNLIKTVATSLGVKLNIEGDGKTYYYPDFNSTFDSKLNGKKNSKTATITVLKGTYNKKLKISENNVIVKGPNYDKSISSNGTRTEGVDEAILNQGVQINADSTTSADNVKINGFTICGSNSLKLYCSQSNIDFEYNICKPTSNSAIIDGKPTDTEKTTFVYSSYIHSNITIKNNYTYCEVTNQSDVDANSLYTVDVNFRAKISNLDIENNYFSSANETLSSKDFGINLEQVIDGTYINIKDNNFDRLGSNYIVNIGASHSTKARINAYINIQGNNFTTSTTTFLGGNGIRALYLGAGSIVNINNNIICTSTYNNAILLSNNTGASTDVADVNTKVNINNNEFYSYVPTNAQKLIDESSEDHFGSSSTTSRNTVTSNYSRIGIGITACVFSALNNYKATAISKYAYLDLSKSDGAQGKIAFSSSNYVTDLTTTATAKTTYNTTLTTFTNFLKSNTSEISSESIYYGILTYDTTEKTYAYTGTDAAYMIAVLKYNATV